MANFKMGSQTVFTQTDDSTPVFDTSVKYTAGEVVQIKYKQLTIDNAVIDRRVQSNHVYHVRMLKYHDNLRLILL